MNAKSPRLRIIARRGQAGGSGEIQDRRRQAWPFHRKVSLGGDLCATLRGQQQLALLSQFTFFSDVGETEAPACRGSPHQATFFGYLFMVACGLPQFCRFSAPWLDLFVRERRAAAHIHMKAGSAPCACGRCGLTRGWHGALPGGVQCT
jgi:hypothetical protein